MLVERKQSPNPVTPTRDALRDFTSLSVPQTIQSTKTNGRGTQLITDINHKDKMPHVRCLPHSPQVIVLSYGSWRRTYNNEICILNDGPINIYTYTPIYIYINIYIYTYIYV